MYTHEQVQSGVSKFVLRNNGNRFLACREISNKADAILKSTGHVVSESEAVSWAITGVPPVTGGRNQLTFSAPKTKYSVELLSYVDDEGVKEAAEESFSQSVRLGHLTFYYPTKLNKYQKARARVLTRMCWYNK